MAAPKGAPCPLTGGRHEWRVGLRDGKTVITCGCGATR